MYWKLFIAKVIRLFLLLLLVNTSYLFAQMPPHPKLLENIKKGIIPKPYTLQNIEKIRATGVDASWTSNDLINQKKLKKTSRFFGNSASPTGSWRALVILVQFSDKPSQVNNAYFDNLLFQKTPGSLNDFYDKVSFGNLDIVTVNLPSVLGWQNAPQTYAYYTDGQNGFGNYPQNAQKLVEDVVQIVDPVVDYSQYDNDNDGYVDALFVVHTGPGAEFTGSNDDIWSHAWVTNTPQNLDGVIVSRYSMEPEYWATPGDMTIGVFAHELGHAAFGLPDLYDTDYSSVGLGVWSLMASGSWNGILGDSPSYPDAFCHIQMGFVNPTVITSNILGQAIPNVEDNSIIYKLWKNGVVGPEYFLVENRQQVSYDQALPNGGLLVFHIDENVNTGNQNEWYPGHTSSGHYLVALEQADGFYDLEHNINQGDVGDTYPGLTNNTNFSNSTVPDSKAYNFTATGVAVKNISPSSLTMNADLEVFATDTTLMVISPNGGENWPVGYTKQIMIDAINTGTFKLEYTTDNEVTWTLIGNVNPSAPKSFANDNIDIYNPEILNSQNKVDTTFTGSVIDWIVPNTPSGQCKIRVTSLTDSLLTDQSDNTFNIISVPSGQFSIQFNYDATAVTGAPGNAGAIFLSGLNEFWTSRWASGLLHRWTKQGALIEEFSIAGVSGTRAMTYDGNKIYAVNNSTTISIINPSSKTITGNITAPIAVRFITFDSNADNGQGGFWIGNWSTDLFLINRTGSILKSIPLANLGIDLNYGAAYDNLSPGGPYLWLSSQYPGQKITQISIATGLPTGIEHDIESDIGTGISGGLFISTGLVNGKATIGGILQGVPDHLYGYELSDVSPSVTVFSPNGGEQWGVGSTHNIKWTSTLIDSVKIEYSVDNGTNWLVEKAGWPTSSGNYQWTVPNSISTQCLIRISDFNNASINDVSDNVFSIINLPIAVITPELFELNSVPGDSVTTQLNIRNDGLADLNWAINKPVTVASNSILNLNELKKNISERAQLVVEGKSITDGFKKIKYNKKDIVRVFYNPSLSPTGLKIALLSCAGSDEIDDDVANKLLATGKFSSITIIKANTVTPTFNELKLFDAVLVYSNLPFLNATEFGDNLADYADAGGGVVLSLFAMVDNPAYSPGGKFLNSKYLCVPYSEPLYGPLQTLGQVFYPNDPILQGVTSFNGGTQSYRQSNFNTLDGSKRVANWSDGSPLIVTKINNEVSRADILFFPSSSDVRSDFWDSSTDGAKILANALMAVGGTASWLTFSPDSGTVAPSANTNISIKANAKNLSFGVYYTNIILNTNDPANSSITIPIKLDVKGLELTSPNGGETYKIGSKKNIQWRSNSITNIKIELTTDNEATWTTITASTPADSGSYQWTVPDSISTQCKIRISDTADPSFSDMSDSLFSIQAYGPIAEIEPNNTLGEAMQVVFGDTVDASVNPIGDIDYFKIQGNAEDTLMVYAAVRDSSLLDGRITLLDQNGNYLTSNDDFTSILYSRVVFILPNTGIYYVRYAYYVNNNGISKPEENEKKYKLRQTERPQINKGPELGIGDQGNYRIVFNYFKKSAPIFAYTYPTDLNYNSVRLYGQIYPNGLDTKVTIDYGTTTSYGNSLVVTTNANSLNEWYFTSDKITGLQANTQYHYRVTLQNALGTTTGSDYNFTTPLAPDGWVFQNSGITAGTIYSIDFIDHNNGVAVGGIANTILLTSDGGTTWINRSPNLSPQFYGVGVDFINQNKIVAVGTSGRVLISTDKGITWTAKLVGNSAIYGISFIDSDTGILGNDFGEIYKTTNGGNSWIKLNSGITVWFNALKMLSMNRYVGVCGNRIIITSTDGGNTWNSQQLNGNGYDFWDVSFTDQNNGMIVGDAGMAYKTTDGGISWNTMNGFNGYFYDVDYLNTSSAIAVGSFGMILRTNDGGNTWVTQNSGTLNHLWGISFINNSQGWISGGWGTILKSQAQGVVLSGLYTYDNSSGTTLPDVKINLQGPTTDSTFTDANGNYSFNGLANGTYQLHSESAKQWGGVNSTDALIIKRHVVQLDTLNGLRLATADVNGSGSVNSTDALIIQRRVVGLTNSFTKGDWIFDNPSVTVSDSNVTLNIKGLTVGDVNGSYNPVLSKANATIIVVNGGTIEVNSNSKIQLPITVAENIQLGAITLMINYPKNLVEIESVTSKASGLLYNSKDGVLSISWSNVKPLKLSSGDAILIVNFKLKSEFKFGNKFNFSLEPASELADEEGNLLTGVKLNIPSVEASIPRKYNITQNYPNPFNPSTTIKYDLPEQAKVTIEIFNVLGQKVKILENSVKDAGSYKIKWNANNFASGIYIYRFMAFGKKEFIQIKKMILLK